MKPIELKITGINSFNNEQVINFEHLYNKGIFGIFGETGSGKSTIIDAITLALYGKITRYDGKAGIKEFININREDCKAKTYLKFCIKSGRDENIYIVERHFKKDETGRINTTLARLTFVKNDVKEIISGVNETSYALEKIIGLEYGDFIRAVVLPQGKFNEFLMLKNDQKREMLERIFLLSKYGKNFTKKINDKKALQEQKFNEIDSKLKELEHINEEKIENFKIDIDKKNEELKACFNELNAKDIHIKNLKEIIQIRKELNYYAQKKEELTKYEKYIQEIKGKLNAAQKVDKIKDLLNEPERINEKILIELKDNKKLKKLLDEATLNFNNTLKKHELAKKEQEERLPYLQNLNTKLDQAINIKKEVIKIDDELKERTKDLKVFEQDSKSLKLEIEKTNYKKGDQLTKLESLKVFLKNNKIDINFRNKLEDAVNLEQNYKKDILDFNNKKQKIKEIEENLTNLKKIQAKYNNNIFKKEEKFSKYKLEISNLKEDQLTLQAKKNNLEKEMLTLQNEFFSLNHEKEDLFKFLKIREGISLELEKVINEEASISQKISDTTKSLNEANEIYNMYNENSVIFKIASKLTDGLACPVCGSKEHPQPKLEIDQIITDEIELEQESLQKSLQNYNIYKNSILETKIKLETEFKNLNSSIKEVEKRLSKVDSIEESLQNLKKELHYLNKCIQDKESSLKSALKNFESEEASLNLFKIEITKVNENIKNSEKNLENLKFEISNLDIQKSEENLKNLKLLFNTENLLNTYNLLKLKEKELEQKDLQRLSIEESVQVLNQNFESLQKNLQDLEKNIISLKTSINEKQVYKANRLTHVDKAFYTSSIYDLQDQVKNTVSSINQILENEKTLSKLKLSEQEKMLNLQKDYNTSFDKIKFLEQNKKSKELEISLKLKENDFSSIDNAKSHYLSKKEQDFIQEKITSFNEKNSKYTLFIEKNTKELKDKNYINTTLENLKETLSYSEEKLKALKFLEKNKTEELILLKKELEEMHQKLNIKNDLLNNFKEEIYKLDLLKELSNITKGSAFVEYMAKNQLQQIVVEAAQRLKLMTNNKFSLELKGTEFTIRDYHNGGVTRSPRSLSGGEVFMVSLSLAIALSSKIQLTNEAPLETLFLDEGFGSLDKNTLDTVIHSLENLQTQNVNVGLITHIEELKNRVNSKILVNFDTQTYGATITLE